MPQFGNITEFVLRFVPESPREGALAFVTWSATFSVGKGW
jgi:hypothetical protein